MKATKPRIDVATDGGLVSLTVIDLWGHETEFECSPQQAGDLARLLTSAQATAERELGVDGVPRSDEGGVTEAICSFCGRVVDSPATSYRKVVGWERRREGGGTNALALREQLDEWAHPSCVELEKVQVPGQVEMF